MQNLRDKLLRAGLVDRKAKKKADHQARQRRTRERRQGVDTEQRRAEKDRLYDDKREQQRQRDRERERARQAEREREREVREAGRKAEQRRLVEIYRARELVQAGMFLSSAPAPVRFHFVSRSGGIRHIDVSTRIAHELDHGKLAIAELPGHRRFGLIRRDVAERVLRVEPALVRFLTAGAEAQMAPEPEVIPRTPPNRTLRMAQHFGPEEGPTDDQREY